MGVPILLHLMMKKRPQHQLFPAMRFLRHRQIANQRQMRLRHWLLLALRMAAIGFLASLFAGPSVDSAGSGYWIKALLLGVLAPLALVAAAYCWVEEKGKPLFLTFGGLGLLLLLGFGYNAFRGFAFGGMKNIGDKSAPVAAAIVFDTSPRMGLVHQNLTRLDEAKSLAKVLISQLPPDSEVAIIDASGPSVFSVDLGNAANMVESLELLGYEHPLADLVQQALVLVSERNDKRQEVYVLSELSDEVWQPRNFAAVRSRLEQFPDTSLFVLDVGVTTPRNSQLGEIKLNTESLAIGQPLRIETTVRATNFAEQELEVTLELENQDATRPVIIDDKVLLPESVTRDRKRVTIGENAEATVSLVDGGLPFGLHHGYVKLTSQDGLKVDDRRYFTVEVRPPLPVLVVSSPGAETIYLEQAISPTDLRLRGQNAFDCHLVDSQELLTQPLEDFASIALLDPEPMTQAVWNRLEQYVRNGGGLGVFLGRSASGSNGVAEGINKVAANVLPGPLSFLQWRAPKDGFLFLTLDNTAHPMLSFFRGQESNIPWDQSPIFRHWAFDELEPGANVIARFSNSKPAIVETAIGKGQVVTMMTPISDRRRPREPWNHLPTSENNLPFFMLMYGMFPYLSNPATEHWNHRVGDIVELPTAEVDLETTWQLFTPQLDWQNIRSDGGKLTVSSTQQAGHYRLTVRPRTISGFLY